MPAPQIPDTFQNRPDTPQNHPDAPQNHPDAPQNRPDAIQNRPDAIQNRPDTIQNHPDTIQDRRAMAAHRHTRRLIRSRRSGNLPRVLSHRSFIHHSFFWPALAVLSLAAPAVSRAQMDFSKVEIKVQKVAGSVYLLMGAGGNLGVSIGDDGIVLVDDDFAPLAPKIEAALKGISKKPVRFVLNTHWHPDHSGGNLAFGRGAPIIAHDNVRA